MKSLRRMTVKMQRRRERMQKMVPLKKRKRLKKMDNAM